MGPQQPENTKIVSEQLMFLEFRLVARRKNCGDFRIWKFAIGVIALKRILKKHIIDL